MGFYFWGSFYIALVFRFFLDFRGVGVFFIGTDYVVLLVDGFFTDFVFSVRARYSKSKSSYELWRDEFFLVIFLEFFKFEREVFFLD